MHEVKCRKRLELYFSESIPELLDDAVDIADLELITICSNQDNILHTQLCLNSTVVHNVVVQFWS